MEKKKINAIIIFSVVAVIVVAIGFLVVKLLNKDVTKTYKTKEFTFVASEALLDKKLEGYDVYFENLSADVVVLGKKETKDSLSNLGYSELTLEKYASAIYESEEDVISKLKQSDDKKFYYFTYDYKSNSDNIFYLGAMYETNDNFWIINFACDFDEKDEYEKKFLEWASSVKFK